MSALRGFRVLSRRRLLSGTLATLALVVGGGAAGLAWLRGTAPDVAGLRCLGAHEYRTLNALATALFPPGGAFAVGADAFDLARLFDGYLADEEDDRRSDLKKALLLLEYGPLVYEHRLVTFSHLSADERLSHFRAWLTSADLVRRQVAIAFRKFLSLVFYDQEEVWPGIGYSLAGGGGTP
jgi:hypothetical protein